MDLEEVRQNDTITRTWCLTTNYHEGPRQNFSLREFFPREKLDMTQSRQLLPSCKEALLTQAKHLTSQIWVVWSDT